MTRRLIWIFCCLSLLSCFSDPSDPDLSQLEGVRGIEFDQEDLLSYDVDANVLRDVSAQEVSTEIADDDDFRLDIPDGMRTRLDVPDFVGQLRRVLQRDTFGFVMQVQDQGQVVATRQCRWARTPGDGTIPWGPHVPMHVASVSKFVTAAALILALRENDVSLDARIFDFLPEYWDTGQHVDLISFRDLLHHRSGIRGDGSGPTNFRSARESIEDGVPLPDNGPATWSYEYDNRNFMLARVLLAVVNGVIDRDFRFPLIGNDNAWAFFTLQHYEQFVASRILTPAAVPEASLRNREGEAFGYTQDSDASGGGWDAGNVRGQAGPVAWHFTSQELLTLAHAIRTPGQVISTVDFGAMTSSGLGFQERQSENRLGIYYHGGLWRHQPTGRALSSHLFLLPGDKELVIFVNSLPSVSVRSAVVEAWRQNVSVVPALVDVEIGPALLPAPDCGL